MAWFKKEAPQSGLPELPLLSLPSPMNEEEEKKEEEISSLPSFPSSEMGERMGREAVKQAIEEEEAEPARIMPPLKSSELREMNAPEEKEEIGVKGPIFIQIEKYDSVLEDLDDAQKKVNQMHEILKDIKQFKEEEENQIAEWESEMLKIKENLSKIDKAIFKRR